MIGKWNPMSTAPRDGTRILVCDGDAVQIGYWVPFEDHQLEPEADYLVARQRLETRLRTLGYWYTAEAEAHDGEYGGIGDSSLKGTHWMALPDPPKRKGGRQ